MSATRSYVWEDEGFFDLTLEEQIGLVKSAVTMADVAELCGYDVTSGDKIRPPWNPTERTPSTHLYEDHFFDYGSGKHGDIFDFVNEYRIAEDPLEEPLPIRKAIAFMRRLALQGGLEPGDVDVVLVRKLENLAFDMPDTPVAELLGLDVSRYGLTQDDAGNVYVPHAERQYPDGRLVYGVKIRHAGGRKGSVPGSQFTHRLYDPLGWQGLYPSPVCVITEGESDCWAMKTVLPDIDVFALPSGAGSWKDSWLEDLAPYSVIHLCFDNDRAGKAALDKVTRKIGWERVKGLKVPGLYNDVRQAVEAGWRPEL